MLSAALTFGFYVDRPLQRRPEALRRRRHVAPLVWLLRALYYLLPNLAPFDITRAGRARAAGAGRLPADDDRLRGHLHHRAAVGGLVHLLEAGPEVTAEARAARPLAFGLAMARAGRRVRRRVEVWRDRVYGEPTPGDAVLYVRSGDALRRMSLSFTPLLADVYWIRTVQYYGGTRLSDVRAEELRPAVPAARHHDDARPPISTSPTGSARSSSPKATRAGPGGRTWRSRSSRRGSGRDPTRWRYLQDIGFVYYWWLGDYRTAAEWFQKAAEIPGAPWWLRSLAAVTLAQGGDRRSSRAALAVAPRVGRQRVAPQQRHAAAGAARRARRHRSADGRRRRLQGHGPAQFPASWDALVRARLLSAARRWTRPASPYVLDPASGAVTLGPDSPLNPLPVGAQVTQPLRCE